MKTAGTKWSLLVIPALCIMIVVSAGSPVHGRQVTDMAGRTVTIGPARKVWPAYPPLMHLVYAIDPSLLVGWTMPISAANSKYIQAPQRNLPVIGGWFGQRTPNLENLAAAGPDFALAWDQTITARPNMVETLGKLDIPVLAVRLFRLSDYPDALRFLGDVLNREERARELRNYVERTIAEMKKFGGSIAREKKVSVYYAIGPDGLTNDCDHMPFLDEAIDLAGGRNVYQCRPADRMMGKKIDMERLLIFDPEVIITQDTIFFSRVYSDPRYRLLKAVKNHRVYMIPGTPFNWLNYPPTYMRALGIRWLAKMLYPGLYTADLRKETKLFFKLFLRIDIGDDETDEILLLKTKNVRRSEAGELRGFAYREL
ncbi:MAG: ABC transporter substrate-binding protein [Syntrophorhabdaceae bacterium]|nr:ABC transporter substrate-binding protein [Syntrophorhabdaceae bacterium]